jgi:hypothetical protein
MSKDLDNSYFIILNKDKIIFSCLNNENKISFTKSHTLTNSLDNLFGDLENFFIDNLIDIEKSLKNFIRKIYIIIDLDSPLSANLSIKYNSETEAINMQKINDLLSLLKYQFIKYSNDQKIIHMKISKSIIDGKEKDLSIVDKAFKNLVLEVQFECLKIEIVNNIKKILSQYQISVEKFLLGNHLRGLPGNNAENILYIAHKFVNGEIVNEVTWNKKKHIALNFFERFFNFFK